jgi:cobaltochelatase CobS
MKTAFKQFDLTVLDGMPANTGHTLMGREPGMDRVPTATPGYLFRKQLVRSFLAFRNPRFNPSNDGLFLTGPTGCGKTSLINEIAARINMPVYEVTGHARMELSEFVSQWIPKDGTVVMELGSLARAMQEGVWFVLNEGDAVDPGVLVGLNEILQKNELTIPSTGQVIKAQPGFAFFMTGNTAGMGDDTGAFLGTNRLNMAFLDRLMKLEVGYMDEADEIALVDQSLLDFTDPSVRRDFATKMVKVANAVRDQFTGKSGGNRIEVTLSTRTLVRWALLTNAYRDATRDQQGKSSFEMAMEQALTAGARKSTRDAINGIIQRYIG